MKITRDIYEKINTRLSNLDYNIEILEDSVGKRTLSEKGKKVRNIGFVNGYLAALQDLEVDFYATLDGVIKIDPKDVAIDEENEENVEEGEI